VIIFAEKFVLLPIVKSAESRSNLAFLLKKSLFFAAKVSFVFDFLFFRTKLH